MITQTNKRRTNRSDFTSTASASAGGQSVTLVREPGQDAGGAEVGAMASFRPGQLVSLHLLDRSLFY